MGISLSDLQHVTLEEYPLDVIESSVPSSMKLTQYMKKEFAELDVTGRNRYAYIPFKFATNMGVTMNTGAFPASGKSQYQRQTIDCNSCVRLSTEVDDVTLQSDSLIGDIMVQLKEEIVDVYPRIINTLFAGDRYGALAKYTAAVVGSDDQIVDETSRLERGMRILTSSSNTQLTQSQGSDLSSGLSGSSCFTVGAINSDVKFTLKDADNSSDQTDDVASGRRLFLDGVLHASGSYAFNTLENIIDSANDYTDSSYGGDDAINTTLYGLTRSSYDILNCKVEHNDNTAVPYREKILRKLLNNIEKKYAGAVKVLCLNYEVEDAIIAAQKSDRIIIADYFTRTPMGDEVPAYFYRDRKIPLLIDEKLRKGNIWALNTDKWYMITGRNDGWENMNGSMWKLKPSSSGGFDPKYIAYFTKWIQFACPAVDQNGVYRDIAVV